MFSELNEKIKIYSNTTPWPVWLIVLIPFSIIFSYYIQFDWYRWDWLWRNLTWIFDNINGIIHETGHFTFYWIRLIVWEFISRGTMQDFTAAAWTGFETIFPIILLYKLWKEEEFYGVAFCLGWLSTSLYHTSWYMYMSRIEWPVANSNFLKKLFDSVGAVGHHDWYYLFSRMWLLEYDRIIAWQVKNIAILLAGISILSATYLIYRSFRNN